MLKWKILAGLGLVFGVAGMVWGYAQQKKAIGFYELRVYTAQPGKRDALAIEDEARLQLRSGQEIVRFSQPPNMFEGRHTHPGIRVTIAHRSSPETVLVVPG